MKLLFSIETPYFDDTAMGRIAECLMYATGIYNGNLANKMFPSNDYDYYQSNNWKSLIKGFIKLNGIDTQCSIYGFNYGFGGTHFWLHDTNGDRILMIYETKD